MRGKLALVTGASRGIGRAIALALAAEGAAVALVARSRPDLARLQAEIVAAGGVAEVYPTDVSLESEVRGLWRWVEATFGRLDLLINCAGVGVFKPLAETSAEEWDRVFAVNARGAFLMCREAVACMARRETAPANASPAEDSSWRPCILNVASVVGLKGYLNQGAYSASKHALVGMTKVLAQELQPLGIRVHVVCPGGVDTELISEARPDLDRSVLMQPEEIAELVLFLARQRGRAIVDQINVRRAASAPWIG
ncbi:MAG: SDR family oxidoreductase [Anaerolineae bacterium]|nr:SDR family oxidoreductase [Anaerolineae bacterium]